MNETMTDPMSILREEGLDETLISDAAAFRKEHGAADADRIPVPRFFYYGKDIWRKALAALLEGENLLLAGPKATGKNVLAENLAYVLGRPCYTVSFHLNVDAATLIGADTYNGREVVFRDGPVTRCAKEGGFCVLDEINMAKNEALAVLHSVLDYRRVIDLPGYERIEVDPACRFIGTMNYGYAGTRELNEALCSRFALLQMPVIGQEELTKLFDHTFPDMNRDVRDQFGALFLDLEKKAEHADISEKAVDLRGLLDAIRMIRRGLTAGEALEMTITDKTFDSYERKLGHGVIAARIPEDMTAKEVFPNA